jgi:hypothetical protein
MRKVIWVILLSGMSSSGMAQQWVQVASTVDGGITVYADQSAIRKEGSVIMILTLGDFKKAEIIGNNNQVSSLEEQYEYDCKEQQMRRLYATLHSGNMGRGKVLDSSLIHEEWQPVPPGSLNDQLWKFACDKK